MKIVFLTKSGQAPTKKFAERLIRENVQAAPGEEITTLAGVVYMDPQVLNAGIRKGEVDQVFVISLLPSSPSAYELASISGPALVEYGSALVQAEKGRTSWDIAAQFIWEKSKH